MPDQSELVAEQFAAYVSDGARRAGYDIDSSRGGGRSALARDTGMSPSSVGRMLAGKAVPDPVYFAPLANALRVPWLDLMVLSGLVPQGFFDERQHERAPMSPREAAADLGIKDPMKVEAFETMVRALLTDQNVNSNERSGEAGAA